MKSHFFSLSRKIQELLTQKVLLYLASLPFFVNWYFILLFYYEKPSIQKQCFRSFVLSLVFFILLLLSWIFSMFPVIGSLLGNVIHLIGILIYVGVSFFLIYKIYKDQNVEIDFLDKQVKNLEDFLI